MSRLTIKNKFTIYKQIHQAAKIKEEAVQLIKSQIGGSSAKRVDFDGNCTRCGREKCTTHCVGIPHIAIARCFINWVEGNYMHHFVETEMDYIPLVIKELFTVVMKKWRPQEEGFNTAHEVAAAMAQMKATAGRGTYSVDLEALIPDEAATADQISDAKAELKVHIGMCLQNRGLPDSLKQKVTRCATDRVSALVEEKMKTTKIPQYEIWGYACSAVLDVLEEGALLRLPHPWTMVNKDVHYVWTPGSHTAEHWAAVLAPPNKRKQAMGEVLEMAIGRAASPQADEVDKTQPMSDLWKYCPGKNEHGR